MSTQGNEGGERLTRTLTAFDGVSMIVGMIIGTGIFASPGVIVTQVEQVGVALIVWIIGGCLTLLGGLCFAELGTALPSSGGEFVYVSQIHPMIGFMFLWTAFFCIKAGSLSIIALIFARYFSILMLPDIDLSTNVDEDYRIKLLAVSSLVGVVGLNILGVEWVAKAQRFFFFTKVTAILFICLIALYSFFLGDSKDIAMGNLANVFQWPPSLEEEGIWAYSSQFGSAVVASLWAYDGFNSLNVLAGELINPQKNIPLAMIIAVSIVIFCYLSVNVAYFMVLPLEVVMQSQAVAITVSLTVWGYWAALVTALLGLYVSIPSKTPTFSCFHKVSISALGSLNVSLMGGSRIIYAGAVKNLVPFSSFFRIVSDDFNTPYPAIILQGIVAIVMLIPGNFESLLNYFGFAAWIFYGLCAVSLCEIRFRGILEPAFKVRPFPLVPVVFILSALLVILSTVLEYPLPSFVATLFILSAIPVYFLFFWRGNLISKQITNLYRGVSPGEAIEMENMHEDLELYE